jgi:hypothetical protein
MKKPWVLLIGAAGLILAFVSVKKLLKKDKYPV